MGRQDSGGSMQRLSQAAQQGGGGRLTDELLLLLREHLAQEQVRLCQVEGMQVPAESPVIADRLSFAEKCLAPVGHGFCCQAVTQSALMGCLVWLAHLVSDPRLHNGHSSCSLQALCGRLPCYLLLMAADWGRAGYAGPASAWRSCALLTYRGLHAQAFSTSPKKAQKAMLQSQLCSNARVLEDIAERERKAVAYAAESLRHKVGCNCDKHLQPAALCLQ